METDIIEAMKIMTKDLLHQNENGSDNWKLVFIHDGVWVKMESKNGNYQQVVREDRTGFTRPSPNWSDRRRYGESIDQYNRRILDTEASA